MTPRISRTGGPAPVFPVARTSTVDLIAQELRSAIYSGALPVGSSLREVEISRQLGVSRSPLREAAQRLVQEGLLTAVPGRGLRVTKIVGDGIIDVYNARLAIESQAVRIVAERVRNGDRSPLSAITQALVSLITASHGEDPWTIGDADLGFHRTLVNEARSARLSRAMATLAVETRITSLSAHDGYVVRRSVSPTYQQLIDALEIGDADAAVAALSSQFQEAIKRLLGEDDSFETVETETENEPQLLAPLDERYATI